MVSLEKRTPKNLAVDNLDAEFHNLSLKALTISSLLPRYLDKNVAYKYDHPNIIGASR